jgi:hypothetical protein
MPRRVFVIALLLAASCATPKAVRDFTAVSKDATAQFPPLVHDLTQSCVRRQLAARPVTEIFNAGPDTAAACQEFSDLEPKLLTTLKVLTNYLGALNALASDDIVTYDKDIDSATANLTVTGAFHADEVTAVNGLAKLLSKALASGYQRRELARDLKSADVHVAAISNALIRIVSEDYVRVLHNEEGQVRSRYRDAMDRDPTHSPAIAVFIQNSWRTELAAIDQKRAAAKAMQDILVKIRDGHKKLAADAGAWNTREVAEFLTPYAGSIQTLTHEFKKTF